MKIQINGKEYSLATTLRVAYKIQGQNGHKSYIDIFKAIENMPIEQQIDIIYAAFECANPQSVKEIPRLSFLNYYLDNYNLTDVMNQLKYVINGILGTDDSESSSTDKSEDSETKNT